MHYGNDNDGFSFENNMNNGFNHNKDNANLGRYTQNDIDVNYGNYDDYKPSNNIDPNYGNYDDYKPSNNIDPNYGNYDDYNPNNNSSYYRESLFDVNINKEESEPKIVRTDEGENNGQDKCPLCGATEISLNKKTGRLRCNFCRHEFEPKKAEGFVEDIGRLRGEVIGSGATDIQANFDNIVTLQCSSCGAEVVIDTEEVTQGRCHWCRNTLSINRQIPNGSVPDVVLPFGVTKEEAQEAISKFVKKRRFFANTRFKREFTLENIMGVYFPYMLVDVNGHGLYSGKGEHLVRKYTVKSGKSSSTRYDADLYEVEREFDVIIKGLTIESSSDKLDKSDNVKTNNIINSILPFDEENAVRWNANYLKGYTSEKRDVNIDFLKPIAKIQAEDVSRYVAKDLSSFYGRGLKWSIQRLDVKGQQWKSAHFPVWLYSYYEDKIGKDKLHYVAVNARTKETMGSIPINMPKLLFVSMLIEFLSGYTMIQIDSEDGGEIILLTIGFIFFFAKYAKYRNVGARHTHEKETRRQIANVRKVDNFISHQKGLSNEKMRGANSDDVYGNQFQGNAIDKATKKWNIFDK